MLKKNSNLSTKLKKKVFLMFRPGHKKKDGVIVFIRNYFSFYSTL